MGSKRERRHRRAPLARAAGALALAALATLATLATGPGAASAEDFSMTGHYRGLYACDSTTAGVPGSWARPMTAAILQDGTSIRIDLTYDDQVEGGQEYSLYAGEIALSPDGSIVAGYFGACGGTFPSLELVRIFPTATAASASRPFQFAANSVWVSSTVPNIPGLTVQTCTWSLTRASTETPTVRPCTTPPG